MSQTYTFWVEGQPVPKGRPRLGRGGHVYTPKRTRVWEELVGLYFHTAKVKGVVPKDPMEGDLGVKLTFSYQTKRHVDLDNLIKGVLDALNRKAWDDDAQIIHIDARLTRTKEGEKSGVLIEYASAELFDSA